MAGAVKVTRSGPIFSGRAEAAVPAMQDDIERTVGQHVVNQVQTQLRRVLRHPTGRYVRQIRTTNRADDLRVTDGGVLYGPWLEGVSRRNRSSRFKGYATFRKVTQRLANDAAGVAEPAVRDGVRRMQ